MLTPMALPAKWIAVDIIGTRLGEDVFIHSAGGERVARLLRRVASKIGFNRAVSAPSR